MISNEYNIAASGLWSFMARYYVCKLIRLCIWYPVPCFSTLIFGWDLTTLKFDLVFANTILKVVRHVLCIN